MSYHTFLRSSRILACCCFYFPTTMVLMYCYGSAFHVNKLRLKRVVCVNTPEVVSGGHIERVSFRLARGSNQFAQFKRESHYREKRIVTVHLLFRRSIIVDNCSTLTHSPAGHFKYPPRSNRIFFLYLCWLKADKAIKCFLYEIRTRVVNNARKPRICASYGWHWFDAQII